MTKLEHIVSDAANEVELSLKPYRSSYQKLCAIKMLAIEPAVDLCKLARDWLGSNSTGKYSMFHLLRFATILEQYVDKHFELEDLNLNGEKWEGEPTTFAFSTAPSALECGWSFAEDVNRIVSNAWGKTSWRLLGPMQHAPFDDNGRLSRAYLRETKARLVLCHRQKLGLA